MVDTLPTNPPPDGYDVKHEIALYVADFGDGYSQRAGKGLNNTKRMFPFMWTNLTTVEMTTLKTFFQLHSDGSAWYYRFPDELNPRKYYLKDYTIKYEGADTYQVTANVQEVYDV